MRQALHIFQKDVRHLRLEIGIVLALALILSWAERRPGQWLAETLFTLAACVLIARLVHAEAIPGDNQFWITRPYRWQSLLGAKILFVVLFVSMPLLLEQFFLAAYVGFSPAAFWPGLLWCQALILCCAILPIVAMAALTPGISSFISFALALMALELVTNSELRALFGPLRTYQEAEGFGSVEWVRSSIALVGAALISISVIYTQYNGRRTVFSRWVAAGAGAVFGLAYFFLPWTAALKFESVLSERTFDASALTLELDFKMADRLRWQRRATPGEPHLIVPMVIHGAPRDLEMKTDAVSVSFKGADGRTWTSDLRNVNARTMESGAVFTSIYIPIDPDFYRDEAAKPATFHAKVYLTALADGKTAAIPVRAKEVDTIEGLHCGTNFLDQVTCASAFRWPGRAIYAGFNSWGGEAFTTSFSYSPFPGDIGFRPFEIHWVSTPKDAATVNIIAKKPVSHFERDFEVRGVRLNAFKGN